MISLVLTVLNSSKMNFGQGRTLLPTSALHCLETLLAATRDLLFRNSRLALMFSLEISMPRHCLRPPSPIAGDGGGRVVGIALLGLCRGQATRMPIPNERAVVMIMSAADGGASSEGDENICGPAGKDGGGEGAASVQE